MDRLLRSLPFLAAFFIAVAAMPTHVVQVNAKQMGTEYAQPWRAKVLTGLERAVGAVHTRITAIVDALAGHPLRGPALAGAALVVAALVAPDHAWAVVGVAGSLKLHRANVEALSKELKDKKAERAAIGNLVVAEKREMTDDERKKFATDLPGEIAKIEAKLETAKELLAAAEESNEAERNSPAIPDPDTTTQRQAARVVAGQLGSDDDPKRGFKSHSEQMTCIIAAGRTGKVDPRLVPLAAAGSDEQSGHTDPYGGFLLAPAFAPGLLSVPAEVDPVARLVTRIPMTNSRVIFNARVDKNHTSSVSGGLTVSRTPAAKAATASRQEFEQVELVAHDLVGAAYATNRILKESPTSFIALMQAGFGDEFAAKKLDERLNGSGGGEFQGVIADDGTITVTEEIGQSPDTIVFENVNKMVARCWRYGSAIWLVNHDALPQVTTLYMPIGSGGERVPIYAPGHEDAPFGTLLGRPIFPTEFCRTVGDLGDIVLGNWSQYLEGDYGPMEEARSIHVRFLEREEAFLFVEMNDAKPWWRSALTPKYSATTLSPFVVLSAR